MRKMTEMNGVPPEEKNNSIMSDLYETVESFVYVIVVMLAIFCFVVRPATVFGSSMVPTLQGGDQLVLQQLGYHDPAYGDVVVIDRTHTGEETLIKRVIGKEGDIIHIDFDTHQVWRNDILLDEPYINEPTALEYDVQFPVRVPEGKVFVMGDNRNHSDDSRDSHIGMVDLRRIMGKAVFRFLPLHSAGGIE